MTLAVSTPLTLPGTTSKPVGDPEGQKVPVDRSVGAIKPPCVKIEEFVPQPISLASSEEAEGQRFPNEGDVKEPKGLLVVVEEIPTSPLSLESGQGVERRQVTIEEDVKAFNSPLVNGEKQTARYHEDNTAQYCLPNEQVHSERTQSSRA
jgi:hypothetical protein